MGSPRARTVLLLFLLPLWLLCMGLSLHSALRPMGYPPIRVQGGSAPDGHPVVTGFTFGFSERNCPLRMGDRLLRVGRTELRNTGPVTLFVWAAQDADPRVAAPVLFERGGQRREEQIRVGSCAIFLPRFPAAVAFMAAALLLHIRARPTRLVEVLVPAQLCVAFLFACTFAGSWPVTLASIPVHILSLSLGAPLAMKAALMFPHGDPARGRLSAVWPWGFAVLGPLDASRAYGLPFSPQVGAVALPAASAAFLGAMLWALTVNYRRSDPIGRRRLKWNLLGVYVACAPPMAASAASVFVPGLAEYVVLSAVTLGLIPVFLLISILRYNLLDIDRLISVTASYTLLSVVLLAAFLTGVPTAARALSNSTGVESATTQAVLAVLVAAILVPLHGRLRPQIDRIFFTERWALQQGTGRLLKELAACRGAEALIAVLGDRLDRLLRPESCVVYGLGQGIFSPIFVRGKAVPPAFASGSAFVGLLRDQHGAIQTMDLASSGRAGALSHFDQAALEALGGPVALPMRQREELVAFVCLGPKGSGDIYTATDLALLTTVADRASLQLSGFDQEKVIRESLAMQEALRRYVPGELASRLESGRDLEVGEREVTILFVDIRGYSSYAEGRRPLEVFSTINRYTQAVSQLVHAHGGNVVEFNGDGMMAVFGAPGLLQDKERCALRAALAIVPAVEALRPEGAVPDDFALAVGLGIATGEVFVGSVRAADRLIWTAIGATTNLAARLQALTRELSAAVVIDAATWGKAGALAAPFQRLEGVRIRGLESPAELYALRPA